MNAADQPTPPLIPPAAPIATPPMDDANLHPPIAHFAEAFEAILRQPRRVIFQLTQPGAARLIGRLAMVATLLILLYGVVVGTFSGGMQLWAAPLKITLGLMLTALICLPSLYIFACLGGAQTNLKLVGGLIAGLVALMSVLLMGFAPVAWVFSQSTQSVWAMGLLHILFVLIALSFGLRLVKTGLTQVGGKSGGLRLWAFIFILVLLQMTTALRPLVGTSSDFLPTEKKFFLNHWLDSLEQTPASHAATPGQETDRLQQTW